MPDLQDYLLTGVMTGNQFGIELPFDPFDLEIAALDTADEIIEEHRRNDRAFDAACDINAQGWTHARIPLEQLRTGTTITVHGGQLEHRGAVRGTIMKVNEHWITTTGGGVRVADWDEHGWAVVPVPLDLSTLGKYEHGPTAPRMR